MQNRRIIPLIGLLYTLCAAGSADAAAATDLAGSWNAWLESPGGKLRFGLEVRRESEEKWSAAFINGPERIGVPVVVVADDTIRLDITHYDSEILAKLEPDGTIGGVWEKRQGLDAWSRLDFRAERATGDSSPGPSDEDLAHARRFIEGRWSVDFGSSSDPAIGIFDVAFDGSIQGTFLTTTGDYRYLAGTFVERTLELSCFDGAHAFLFRATVQEDGSLVGDFWSRDSWHETWTARRDADAELPDPLAQTTWIDGVDLAQLRYAALDGSMRSPVDPAFTGKARIIEVFGTWCPNCRDATNYLVELDQRFGDRGLSIIGLAFEVTGDAERDRAQVRRYAQQHGIEYPILIAGVSEKAAATRAFPALDRVRSYPTFIFMDESGVVRGIYTGFSGPATGPAHDRLRETFETLIESILEE